MPKPHPSRYPARNWGQLPNTTEISGTFPVSDAIRLLIIELALNSTWYSRLKLHYWRIEKETKIRALLFSENVECRVRYILLHIRRKTVWMGAPWERAWCLSRREVPLSPWLLPRAARQAAGAGCLPSLRPCWAQPWEERASNRWPFRPRDPLVVPFCLDPKACWYLHSAATASWAALRMLTTTIHEI